MSGVKEEKGNFLWRFSQKFQFAADKIIPESMVFCLILTIIVYLAALIFTKTGPVELAHAVVRRYVGPSWPLPCRCP